jgi:cytochrome P450
VTVEPPPALTGPSWALPGPPRPVRRVVVEGRPAWLVTGHRDVSDALAERYPLALSPGCADGADYSGFELPAELSQHLLALDGPQHARLRGLVAPHLSAHRIAEREPAIAGHARRLVAEFAGSRVDLVRELVAPLPIEVVADLVGLPAAARTALAKWAAVTLGPSESAPRARDGIGEMTRILAEAVEGADRCPAGMLTDLRTARREGRCSRDELVSALFYVVFVFFEVAVDAGAAVLLRLLSSPQRAAFASAGRSRGHAIDEVLRHDAPQLLAAPRFATEDFPLRGERIRTGQTVLLSLAGANRDPDVFTDPHRVDLARRPNPHLSFGRGTHACPAAALTRQLLDAAVSALLDAHPHLALAETDPPVRGNFRHRGPDRVLAELG